MKRPGPMQALASSPTIVGAITTLILIVAVFLAYNANNSLPFVKTYKISVDVPNASRLVRSNEVRSGGHRIGVIESIDTVAREGEVKSGESNVVARLNLKLDKSASPIPVNSTFRVRYRSSFGLKYLEITRGDGEGAPEGTQFNGTNDIGPDGQIPLTLAEAQQIQKETGDNDGVFIDQTEFDEIGNTFDQRTRQAARQNLVGYGTGFAGRGASLNQAIESLSPLFKGLKPVSKALIERSTRLKRLFPELGDAARIIAPIAKQQADLFVNMATTFGAISEDPEALKATISEGPPTLRTGIELLPLQRPFLTDFAELSRRLRPGVRELRRALPDLNSAIKVGTEVLPGTVQTNQDLGKVLRELERLVDLRATGSTLKRLRETFKQANPLARYVVPAQTVCNLWNYWFTMLPEHLSERDQVGFNQRVSIIGTPMGPQTFNIGGTDIQIGGDVPTPVGGYSGEQANGQDNSGLFDPHTYPILHGPAYQPTGQRGTNADCQPGQAGYPLGSGALRVAGLPRSNPAVGVADLPGSRGPLTVFFKQNGDRLLVDTRVASRQP